MGHTQNRNRSRREREKQQAGQQVTVGRHVQTLPTRNNEATILASRVEQRTKADEALRKLQQENAALQLTLEKERIDRNIEDIAILKVQAGELSKLDARKLGRTLSAKFERHCREGLAPSKFDPYSVMNTFMARIGKALPLPDKHANPLSAQLPPPRQEGHVHANDRAADLASRSAYQERSARHRDREIKDRERYDKRLRELGLTRPDIGYPGSGELGH